jgi:hypothetical protein
LVYRIGEQSGSELARLLFVFSGGILEQSGSKSRISLGRVNAGGRKESILFTL